MANKTKSRDNSGTESGAETESETEERLIEDGILNSIDDDLGFLLGTNDRAHDGHTTKK